MSFLEKQEDPTSPMHYPGNLQVDNMYTSGVAGDKFFKQIIEKGSFLASECKKCGTKFCPPRLYCEDCFVEIPDEDWKEVPAVGTVRLFTTAVINTYGEYLDAPRCIALIDIEGTDGAMLGLLKTDDTEKDLIGAKVEAVFRPKEEREGTLKDIQYYKILP
jgi:uncharacterized OB-fold protein